MEDVEEVVITKFKKGDKIKCISSSMGFNTKDQAYIAGQVYTFKKYLDDNWLETVLDSNGSNSNGFWVSAFELYIEEPKKVTKKETTSWGFE